MPQYQMVDKKILPSLPGVRDTRWRRTRDMMRFAARRLKEERLPQVAGSLTFTSMLALVPIVTIAFAIFTSFSLFNTFRATLEAYFVQSLMPYSIANTILGYLNQFASQARRVSAVGAVALVLTAIVMLGTIDHAFNHIWRVKERRPLLQRILMYWAIFTLGPLLIGASMTVTSYLFVATNDVAKSMPFIGGVFFTLISIALTAGTFTLLYMVVPNRFVDWRDAAWGGLAAAIAFEIAKRLFAIFVAKFPTYTVVYGTLAAVPMFLIWIYLSWLITLIGAAIAATLPIIKYERWWHVPTPGTAFVDAIAVLQVLYTAREKTGVATVDAGMIRMQTRLGFGESEALLQKMADAGWVGRIKKELPTRVQWGKRITQGMDCWALLVNPDKLKLADVYRLFMFNGAGNPALATRVEAAIEDGLDETLTAHFSSTLVCP